MKPRKEKLEQELKSLTETKQKLKKEIHHLKANMRNNNSIMVDLSNQTHSCDGSFIPIQSLNYKLPPIVVLESMNQFSVDIFKRKSRQV